MIPQQTIDKIAKLFETLMRIPARFDDKFDDEFDVISEILADAMDGIVITDSQFYNMNQIADKLKQEKLL